MNGFEAKLGLGPMSKEIIESIYSYSADRKVSLMIIASKNQVDWDGGYVMTTAELGKGAAAQIKKYPEAQVALCRDHCGPGFNGRMDLADSYRTIEEDVGQGFDLIHVDFCHAEGERKHVLEEAKKAIKFALKLRKDIRLEIGTDENTGRDLRVLAEVEQEMAYFTDFCEPEFFVVQTGSLIMETRQAGTYDAQYAREAAQLGRKYDLKIKEHNADYLPVAEIRRRRGIVGAVNVAPQLGVVQTVLSVQKALTYGLEVDEFLETAYRSGKWKKWLDQNTAANKMKCAVIAGHYVFGTKAYQELYEQLNQAEDFAATLKGELWRLYDLYTNNLRENDDLQTVDINLGNRVAAR